MTPAPCPGGTKKGCNISRPASSAHSGFKAGLGSAYIPRMTKFLPLLLAVGYAVLMLRFSVWRTKKMLDAQSQPLTDPSITRLADRMAAAMDLPEIKVNVFEVEPVNGLAAPDGRIFLTRGFLNRKARGEVTAEELASVIAHELGHVALGHMRRRMIDFTGQNAVFVMLSAVLNRFMPFIGIWIANLISTALMARLSRRDEFEADAYATRPSDQVRDRHRAAEVAVSQAWRR